MKTNWPINALFMNLKFHLLLRIALVAILCLVATAVYILIQGDRRVKQETRATAESVTRQLELQLLRIDIGFGRPDRFPDLELWKETRTGTGGCVHYISADSEMKHNICLGTTFSSQQWPAWFEKIYRFLINPDIEVFHQITFKDQVYGSISVVPDVDSELARAWESLHIMMELSAITVLAVCVLVFFAVNRLLSSSQVIVNGLEKMNKGDLTVRLPPFEIKEWEQTGDAINALAASQQQLQSERQKLALKLITLQEEERRFLARELHDELGQCLAAVSAVSASIVQTAERECPDIVPEAENISRINLYIMDIVRNLLLRLRPAELDELGLDASLNGLISEWNARTGGKIRFQLMIEGTSQDLSEPLPITLFRIVQECLTNIAKHSNAKNAIITLSVSIETISLVIEDDGKSKTLPCTDNTGIGLLGIRERVIALGGQLSLEHGSAGGFIVRVQLPVQAVSGEPV